MKPEELGHFVGEISSDVKWIKEWMQNADKKYAKKWVERVQWFMIVGVMGWMLTQVLSLIPVAKAFFNF